MDQHSVKVIIETLKEEGVDLAVTLPEEPTSSLTNATRRDPYFTTVNVAGESGGIALCAGAALGGAEHFGDVFEIDAEPFHEAVAHQCGVARRLNGARLVVDLGGQQNRAALIEAAVELLVEMRQVANP